MVGVSFLHFYSTQNDHLFSELLTLEKRNNQTGGLPSQQVL